MHPSHNKNGFTLIELIVVIAILGILSAVLIPVISTFVDRANNQADIANARLLLLATTIAFGADGLGNGVYTANADGSSPLPYREMLGPAWPVSKIGLNHFIVDVDFSRDPEDAIQVIRVVGGVDQVYRIEKGLFE